LNEDGWCDKRYANRVHAFYSASVHYIFQLPSSLDALLCGESELLLFWIFCELMYFTPITFSNKV
jgi:hypothetical protein